MGRVEIVALGLAAGALAVYLAEQDGIGSIDGYLADAGSAMTAAGGAILEAIGMRGIRNNNPGNIRRAGTKWQGMSDKQTDPSFVQFVAPEYGIRALSRVLDTYANTWGLNTVAGIISRWAPASENNTAAYVSSVAGALGVGPNDVINVAARKADLIQAIIRHENGIQPYSLATIQTGVTMA